MLAAFASPGLPSPAELDAIVADDIAALVAMQLPDGGFGWWSGDPTSSPFTSLQAAAALGAAKAAGYAVPDAALTQALGYVDLDRAAHPRGVVRRDALRADGRGAERARGERRSRPGRRAGPVPPRR